MKRSDGRAGERGAVTIKTIVVVFFLLCVVFVGMRVVPIYVEQRKIIYDVEELARIATVRGYKDDRIAPEIAKIRTAYDLPEGSINLLERVGPGVQITVNYTRSVDLLVTSYDWKVEHRVIGKEI